MLLFAAFFGIASAKHCAGDIKPFTPSGMTAMPRKPYAGESQNNQKPHSESATSLKEIEINPIEFVARVKQNRLSLAAVVFGVMAITALVMVLTPNRYRSHASILPSGNRDQLSGLMEIAGQFGVGSMAAADENSSSLYPSILRSNLVRNGVLEKNYPISSDNPSESITLDQYFETDDPNELRAALSGITSISEDKKLGIIRMNVETTSPELSRAILSEYLAQLESYLRFKRRSQARENEEYLVAQKAKCRQELTASEDSLQGFMQVNRNWNSSSDPRLQTELARLRREVEVRAKTYLLLTQQLELARLEVQKDIPIVRILDEPSFPTFKSGPQRTFNVLLAGCIAFLAAITWLFVRDILRQIVSSDSDGTDETQPLEPNGSRLGSTRRLQLKK